MCNISLIFKTNTVLSSSFQLSPFLALSQNDIQISPQHPIFFHKLDPLLPPEFIICHSQFKTILVANSLFIINHISLMGTSFPSHDAILKHTFRNTISWLSISWLAHVIPSGLQSCIITSLQGIPLGTNNQVWQYSFETKHEEYLTLCLLILEEKQTKNSVYPVLHGTSLTCCTLCCSFKASLQFLQKQM